MQNGSPMATRPLVTDGVPVCSGGLFGRCSGHWSGFVRPVRNSCLVTGLEHYVDVTSWKLKYLLDRLSGADWFSTVGCCSNVARVPLVGR